LVKTQAIESSPPGENRETALVKSRLEPWRDPDWQRLWLAVEPRPWRSLGLVPAGAGAALDFTMLVAITLSRTGMVHLGSPIQIADATQIPLSQLSPFLKEVNRCTSDGDRILIALPPTGESPITASIAQSIDAVVLCVMLERMSNTQAKQTIKAIGASRFIGSAIFRPDNSIAR